MSKITIDRAALEQALDMFERGRFANKDVDELEALCDVLHAALEQPQVEQGPCGHMRWKNGSAEYVSSKYFDVPLDEEWHLIYTHPQPPRQPLTDEQITQLADTHTEAFAQVVGAGEVWFEGEKEFARAIERAHGIGGEGMNTVKNVLAVIGASVVWFSLLGTIGIGHFEMCYGPNERACNITGGEK